MVIHPGSQVGHHLKGPPLAGTVQFEHLFLTCQLRFLIMTGHPGIGHGFSRNIGSSPEAFGAELHQIITTVATRSMCRAEFSFAFPTP